MTTTALFEIWRLARRAGALLDAALARTALTPADFGLYSLLRYSGPLTATDITKRTGMPPTTVSQQLRRLDRRGHLRREPNPDDARSSLVALSAAGTDTHEEAGPAFRRALAQLEIALGDDYDQVIYSLQRLDHALRRATDEPVVDPPARLPRRPRGATAHHVTYSGDPLTENEVEHVREYIAFLRWRRADADRSNAI